VDTAIFFFAPENIKKSLQKLLIINPKSFFQFCPKQPGLPRQLKKNILYTAFSMFPILDTNL
jgi:hypothetical protein